MSQKKFLDKIGLQNFLNRIKALIPTKTSELQNDSGFITSEGTYDSALSLESEKAVQNKVVTAAINGKQDTLSTAQTNAVDSGITSAKVQGYDSHISDTDIHVTQADKTSWDSKAPGTHTHLASEVSGLSTVATSGSYSDLTNKPTIDSALSSTSTNAVQNKVINTELGKKANTTDLATVATSGSYADLTNKPTIPTVNNATLTIQKNGTTVKTFTANSSTNVTADITVPTKVSELTNDSGFLTSHNPIDSSLSSTSTNAVQNKVVKAELDNKSDTGHKHTVSDVTDFPTLSAVATSGSYNDLSNKPTIPAVYNKTLTIQQNGTKVASFTSNSNTNVTANITVPTAVSELTNDSGYLTAHQSLADYSTKADTIKDLSISGKVITYTKGDDTTGTLTTQDTVYTHPTSAGNKHIPSGGSANQYLKYSASGTAQWATIKTSELNNDSGFLTSHNPVDSALSTASENAVQNKVVKAELDNKANSADLSTVATTGSYTDLNNIPSNFTPASHTHGSITNDGKLGTASRALITDGNKKIAVSSVTSTELGYLSGVTSAVQDQLDGKAASTHSHTASEVSGLATVATSGSYNDLTNKPTIPTVNNATLTIQKNGTTVKTFTANASSNVTANITVPTKVSELTNDSGFLTSHNPVDSALSDTSTNAVQNKVVKGALDGKSDTGHTHTKSEITDFPTLATVATSGSYNDLTNKPTIPTVNNATLTIQKNGTTVKTFTANASSNVTANITVPTKVSELTNDSGYLTSASSLDSSKLTGTIDIARLPKGALERLVTVADQTARFALTTSDVQLGDTVKQLDTGVMYIVSDESKLSSADGYTEYTAGAATSVPWSGVTGKPSNYTPSSHSHGNIANGGTLGTASRALITDGNKKITTSSVTSTELGYLSGVTSAIQTQLNGKAASSHTHTASDVSGLATVATSGSYNDLSNKPTIPTVNNATLTIQRNGTTVKTFTANASSNVTANITVPTKTSDLTNDSHQTITVGTDTASTASPAHSGTFTCIDSVTRDSNGHVTAVNTKTVTLPADNNTDTLVTQNVSTANENHPILLTVTKDATANQGAKTSIFASGVKVNPSTNTVTATTFSGALSGNASTATQFSANKSVTLTGDVTGTASSKAGWSVATTLSDSGVTAGTYGPSADVTGNNNATISVPEITVDSKGRVTSVANRTLTCKNNTYNVYNKTLTIQKNGTNVATFTSNSNTNVTANITVPTATSELTNDSGFLTEHQSLSSYVTLNSAQTISAVKTISAADLKFSTTATRGTAPSEDISKEITTLDSAGNGISKIGAYYCTDKHSETRIYAYKTTAATGGNIGYLGIGCNTSGNVYTFAPTPATADNSTQIATTAFVKAQGYLTSHQSLSNYSTLANTVKSLSISGKTITVTPGSGSAYTLTTQDTVYTHPTTSGNKHIPSGGSSGQFLGWASDGTAKWVNNPNTNTDTLMTQNVSTTNATYPVLLVATADATANLGAKAGIFGSGVKVNPSTSIISCKGISGTPTAYNSYVNAVKDGGSLVSSLATYFGGVWSAPTKNYRVAAATFPNSGDNVYICYSVTNANVEAGTNHIAKQLTWNADSGVLTADSFSGSLTGNVTGNVTGNCSGSSGSCTGNAATATKATGNANGKELTNTIIKGLSISGKTITYTQIDGTTGTITTQDTNTDTLMTQNVSTTNATYPVLLVATADATANQGAKTGIFAKSVKVNPSTNVISASGFSGPLTGNVTGNCSGSSGSCTGNAATATQFSANKSVTLTGDVTGTASSKAGWSVATTLANSGVTAGTYGPSADVTGNNNATISVPQITVDAKGRVTSVTNRTLTCKNNTYTVNNATLTIQKNGTNVATFTSNASSNATANITVPTKVSELTNDSGFLTSHQDLSLYPYKVASFSNYGNGRWPYIDLGDTTTHPNGFNEIVATGKYHVRWTNATTVGVPFTTSAETDGILEVDGTTSASGVTSYQRVVQRIYRQSSAHIVYFRYATYHDGAWNWSNWTSYGDIVTHNASEFLTSHQSLANYSTLANTVKSLSISGKTITVTPGSGSAYTLTTQDTNTKVTQTVTTTNSDYPVLLCTTAGATETETNTSRFSKCASINARYGYLTLKNTYSSSCAIGTAPSSVQTPGSITLRDYNGDTAGVINSTIAKTSGNVSVSMVAYNKITNGALDPEATAGSTNFTLSYGASGKFLTTDAAWNSNVNPLANNSKTLGTSSLQWKALYATTVYEGGTALTSKYAQIANISADGIGTTCLLAYFPTGTNDLSLTAGTTKPGTSLYIVYWRLESTASVSADIYTDTYATLVVNKTYAETGTWKLLHSMSQSVVSKAMIGIWVRTA